MQAWRVHDYGEPEATFVLDEIPFTLCYLRPSLPVADDATDEQHYD